MDGNETEKLKALQNEELSILTALRDYFDEKGYRYYLGFGTLLGAVRHNGFIPWDDDIDIFMEREDYRRFLQEAEVDLPEWLTIRTYHNTEMGKGNFAIQAKVEARTHYVLRKLGNGIVKHRIWVDIFTIDGMPKTQIRRTLHYKNIQLHYLLCRIARTETGVDRNKKRPIIEKMGIELVEGLKLRRFFDVHDVYQSIDDLLGEISTSESEYVITYAKAYGERTIVPKRCFGEGKKLLFEGTYFNAPDDPDTLLKSWYGDYMQLPPVEKRKAKHCVDIIIE